MLTKDQVNKIIDAKLQEKGLQWSGSRLYVLAIRGNDGNNNLGVFDDRAYVVFDKTIKGVWDMNTDPSTNVTGRATLTPGVWKYKPGKHHMSSAPPKGRAAFIQAGEVTVHRFNQGNETGYFGINLHDATGGTTSSLGCQTFKQYDGVSNWTNSKKEGFRDVVYRILKVTPEGVMSNPSGDGAPWFFYILVTLSEAEEILKRN